MFNIDEKPKRKRVCHTCAISMDNIMVENLRNSIELSFEEGGDLQLELDNPVLARSFEKTVKDSIMLTPSETDRPIVSKTMIITQIPIGETQGKDSLDKTQDRSLNTTLRTT